LQLGEAVIFPTHNSLLADYYSVRARPRVYYIHRGGIHAGAILGTLLGAGLAAAFSWRVPFVVFAGPLVGALLVGTRLREPPRGRHEQIALAEQMAGSNLGEPAGLSDDPPAGHGASRNGDGLGVLDDEQREHPPSLGEAWRMVWKIGVLRRIFYALPMLAVAVAGFGSLESLQYQKTFGLDATERSFLVAPASVFAVVGLVIGALLATRLARSGMKRVFDMLALTSVVASGFAVLFALAPSVPLAFVGDAGIELSLAVVAPGILAALSLAIPARARSLGFSITALFVLPGLVVLPVVGLVGDDIGFRYGLLVVVPVFLVGGLIIASAGSLIDRDVRNVWTSIRTRARMLVRRRAGELPLLAVQDLTAGYEGTSVLWGIDMEIAEGEIVALLGTNGAGKSTLLRAIGGVVEADGGAIVFDGRDITHTPPHEIARLGISQVPGGAGVFPNLTVQENLRAAAWQGRKRHQSDRTFGEALGLFPSLAQRRSDRAGDLSGGQQQMLGLAMALLAGPRLLLIDELSLGLAPIVVEQLLSSVEALRERGTAVLLVEQSVDVAVSVADRGYVLDAGTIRYSGTAAEIRERPELLWSIYLRQADAGMEPARPGPPTSRLSPAGDAPTSVLELSDVSASFGGVTALDRVDLSIRHGEVVGVIGPNGAGKTTLFDIVSGFVRPSGGRVVLHGIDVTGYAPHVRARLGLGRSFQDSRLFGTLTVREVLALALERFVNVGDPLNAMLRLPTLQQTEAAIGRRVGELLTLFSLDAHADKLVSELSTGLRRLVDLAAVVAHQPDVVLLDEPSSGVAQREVEAMHGLLRRVRDELDATLLVVEHDITFVSALSDRLVALDLGRLQRSGEPSEVLADPLVREAFLGAKPLERSRSS
jgi:ABC-type branched-subunit amino acid transport system ATPase component